MTIRAASFRVWTGFYWILLKTAKNGDFWHPAPEPSSVPNEVARNGSFGQKSDISEPFLAEIRAKHWGFRTIFAENPLKWLAKRE